MFKLPVIVAAYNTSYGYYIYHTYILYQKGVGGISKYEALFEIVAARVDLMIPLV